MTDQTQATRPGASSDPAAPGVDTAEHVAAVWKPGDVILGLYEVKEVFAGGGMGLVYRVRHRNWDMDLAVKSPRPNFFRSEEQKTNFEREAETWVRLALHPHTAACFYVRRLGGVPRVFAEFIEGGSLADWVRSGRLYAGGPDTAVERILDVALQMAWGLHAAHEQRLVHQDVKPANVLMKLDGTAKVTDFGLARAREATAEVTAGGSLRSVLVSWGGMTPAYCSPEQAEAAQQATAGVSPEERTRLSRKTDVWSWAVSVLELFTGEVTWQAGPAAAEALEAYLAGVSPGHAVPAPPETRPTKRSVWQSLQGAWCSLQTAWLPGQGGAGHLQLPIPPPLVQLLRHCLQHQPDARPKDMLAVAAALLDVYQRVTGKAYPREEPQPTEGVADSLNNRAVSLLDLGKPEEAAELFDEALRRQTYHSEATYNQGLAQWRAGRITEDHLIRRLRRVSRQGGQPWLPRYGGAHICLELGLPRDAVEALKEIPEPHRDRDEVRALLGFAGQQSDNPRHCVRTLPGHTDTVTAVCIGPDGRTAVSGSRDETVRLWNLDNGRCLRTFPGHAGGVTALLCSPDGQTALAGSADGTLRVWELATGRCVRVLAKSGDCVTALAFAADGRTALAGYGDGALKVWDLTTGRCLRTLQGHRFAVAAVYLGADGRLALSGEAVEEKEGIDVDKGRLRLWDVAEGRCLATLDGQLGGVTAAWLSPDGRRAFTTGRCEPARLWDLVSGRCAAVCYDGPRLFTPKSGPNQAPGPGLAEGYGTFIDMVLGVMDDISKEIGPREGNDEERWHRLTEGMVQHEKGLHPLARIHPAAISADGKYVLSFGFIGLNLWEVVSGRRIWWRDGERATAVALSADGRLALWAGQDHTLQLWDLSWAYAAPSFICQVTASDQALAERRAYRHDVEGARAALDRGDYAAAAALVRQARGRPGYEQSAEAVAEWGRLSLKLRRTGLHGGWEGDVNFGHRGIVHSTTFSTDGRLALTGCAEVLKVWDVGSSECMWSQMPEGSFARAVLSGDGRLVLGADRVPVHRSRADEEDDEEQGPDPTDPATPPFRLWDIATGRCLARFGGRYLGEVDELVLETLCLSADGRLALAGTASGQIKLWDTTTGHCLRVLKSFVRGAIKRLSLSLDERCLLAVSDTRAPNGNADCYALSLWELASGRCRRTVPFKEYISSAYFGPTAREAMITFADRLEIWDLAQRCRLRCLQLPRDSDKEAAGSSLRPEALSPDGRFALCSESMFAQSRRGNALLPAFGCTLHVWDVAGERSLWSFEARTPAAFSPDGRYVMNADKFWVLDWDLEDAPEADWDDGARPFLENFLVRHTPFAAALPTDRPTADDEVTAALTRRGTPSWNHADFQQLLHTLDCAGYGRLRPEGVARELERTAAGWEQPPAIF